MAEVERVVSRRPNGPGLPERLVLRAWHGLIARGGFKAIKQLSRIASSWGGKPKPPESGRSVWHGDVCSFVHLTSGWVDPVKISANELRSLVDANELDMAEMTQP